MPALLPARSTPFSYSQGYARAAGRSAFPNTWFGRIGSWIPALGVTGTTLFDGSGHKNHGVFTGIDQTAWRLGTSARAPGYVLDYDGISPFGHVDISGALRVFDTSQGSVCAWINARTLANPIGGVASTAILSAGLSATSSQGITLYPTGSSSLGLFYRSTGGITITTVSGINTLQDYFVVGTWDSDFLRIYIDGELGNEIAQGTLISVSLEQLFIGADALGSLQDSWDGQIGGVDIYDHALTPSAIRTLFTVPYAPARLRRRTIRKAPAVVAALPLGTLALMGVGR